MPAETKPEPKSRRTRAPKAGTKRVTITLTDAQYSDLSKMADKEMREPNNMLSYLLRDHLPSLLSEGSK